MKLNEELRRAMCDGDVRKIMLLNKGANPNTKSEYGLTSLHIATAEEVLRFLTGTAKHSKLAVHQ